MVSVSSLASRQLPAALAIRQRQLLRRGFLPDFFTFVHVCLQVTTNIVTLQSINAIWNMVKPKGSIWSYFKVEDDKRVKCVFCHTVFYKNATRLEKHLVKCFKTPTFVKEQIQKGKFTKTVGEVRKVEYKSNAHDNSSGGNENESTESFTNEINSEGSQASEIGQSGASLSLSLRKYHASPKITSSSRSGSSILKYTDTMLPNEQAKLDVLFARAVYTSEVPLSLTDQSAWIEFFKTIRPSWKCPTRKTLSGPLLDQEYNRISAEVNFSITESKNLALATDSWSNMRNEAIINFTIMNPQPHFIRSIASETQRHTSEYLSEQMANILEEYGADKFLVVMTDNAANERKAAMLLKEKYKHIIPLGCLSHTLNLLVQDILKIDSIDKIIKKVVDIVKHVKKSHILTAAFNKEKNAQISLSLPVSTRWGSNLKALDGFIKAKSTLQKLAVDESTCDLFTKENRSKILDNEIFLVQVVNLAELIRPIVKWIFTLESDEPVIQKVVYAFTDIESNLVQRIPLSPITTTQEERTVMEKFCFRKDYALQPIHYAAVIFDPKDQGVSLNSEQILSAMDFVDNISKDMNENDIDSVTILSNLTNYRNRDGAWMKEIIWKTVNHLEPISWWKGVGSINSKQLAEVAVRVLSMPTSSASTERSFSTFGRIHRKIRNRLTTARTVKLSFISHNYRLLKRIGNQNEENNSKLETPNVVAFTDAPVSQVQENELINKRKISKQLKITQYKKIKSSQNLEDESEKNYVSSSPSADSEEESYSLHDSSSDDLDVNMTDVSENDDTDDNKEKY